MERVTGTVPIECEFALSTCWSKEAQMLVDGQGRLKVWKPTERGQSNGGLGCDLL